MVISVWEENENESEIVIGRNEPIPCTITRNYLTKADDQITIELKIAEGDSSHNCYQVHEIQLIGLKPGPRGSQSVTVTFGYNTIGLLEIRAKDNLGARIEIKYKDPQNLQSEDVDRITEFGRILRSSKSSS